MLALAFRYKSFKRFQVFPSSLGCGSLSAEGCRQSALVLLIVLLLSLEFSDLIIFEPSSEPLHISAKKLSWN